MTTDPINPPPDGPPEQPPSYPPPAPPAPQVPLPGPYRAAPPPPAAGPLSPSDERTWAMLAHLSVLLNLVTGFLGPVAALIIYLVYKDRSRYVAYQAFQSMIFQLIWWVGAGLLAFATFTVGSFLAIFVVGLLCFPIGLLFGLFPLIAVIYGVYAAVETNQGRDFRYWLIGDWVRSMA